MLQHAPGRAFFDGCEELRLRIPPVEDEVALIERYGVRVLGLALNGENLDAPALAAYAGRLRQATGLPVSIPIGGPLADAGEPLLDALTDLTRHSTQPPAPEPA